MIFADYYFIRSNNIVIYQKIQVDYQLSKIANDPEYEQGNDHYVHQYQ